MSKKETQSKEKSDSTWILTPEELKRLNKEIQNSIDYLKMREKT